MSTFIPRLASALSAAADRLIEAAFAGIDAGGGFSEIDAFVLRVSGVFDKVAGRLEALAARRHVES